MCKIFNNYFISLYLKYTKRTDIKRWSDSNNLLYDWNERTVQIAKFIPEKSNVLEFGAGSEHLKSLLLNCKYTPSDIIKRTDFTFICDLNDSVLPKLNNYDVIVFSGVLEYVHDISKVINHIKGNCNSIVTSYSNVERKNIIELTRRRIKGWVNDYNEIDFIKVFTNAGFVLINKEEWRKQKIYLFSKDN